MPLDGQTPGAQLWAQRYDGPVHSHDYATSVGVSPDGTTVYVTGLSYQFGPEPEIADYATITTFRMIFEEREKRKIRKSFSSYVSPGVINLIEKNPNLLAASFTIPVGTEPSVGTRVKMGQTSNVYALVKADGKYYMSGKEIKVTLGGCGG